MPTLAIDVTARFAELQTGVDRAVGQLNRLEAGVRSSQSQMARFADSMDSVGRSVAAFASVAGIGAALQAAIQPGFEFAKSVEQAKLGIGATLSSIATLNGGAIDLGTGMDIAAGTVERLNKAAAATAATGKELVDGFQGIVSPALAAGMSIRQIEELTVTAVNAAKALGIEMGQIPSELRALVSGQNLDDSQIGRAIGVDAKSIAAAKASADGLFGYLQERMAGFAAASDVFGGTWDGILSTLEDTIAQRSAQVFAPLLDEAKITAQAVTEWVSAPSSGADQLGQSLAGAARYARENAGAIMQMVEAGAAFVAIRWASSFGPAIEGAAAAAVSMGTLAVQTGAAATASRLLGAAVAGMGGPIGVVITALGVAASAWAIFGDSGRAAVDSLGRPLQTVEQRIEAVEKRLAAVKAKAKFGEGDLGAAREALQAAEERYAALRGGPTARSKELEAYNAVQRAQALVDELERAQAQAQTGPQVIAPKFSTPDAGGKKGKAAAQKSETLRGAPEDAQMRAAQAAARLIEQTAQVKSAEIDAVSRYLDTLAAAGIDPALIEAARFEIESNTDAYKRNEAAIQAAAERQRAMWAEATSMLDAARTPLQKITDDYAKLLILLEDGAINQEQFGVLAAKAASEFDQAAKATSGLAAAADSVGLAFTSAFSEAMKGGKGLSDILNSLAVDLVQIVAKAALFDPLQKSITSAITSQLPAGGSGGLLSLFSDVFRANGGPVTAGRPYIVGERRPELFVPSTSGTILPYVPQGQTVVNVSIHASDAESVRRSQGSINRQINAGISAARRSA